MDFDCVAASPGNQWVGESASRRRQRRLSSPSLATYLTPAFDAVAAGEGGFQGSTGSSLSSGGLDLGIDASLLRYRRACFSATTDLDHRRLLYSPQSAPPPPQQQARMVYPVAADDFGGYLYGSKRQVDGLNGAPGFQEFKDCSSFISTWRSSANVPTAAAQGASNSIKLPADLQSPEAMILSTKGELSTPKPEVATPSGQATSEQPQPTEEEDETIAQVLYGRSCRRRLAIFKEICPE